MFGRGQGGYGEVLSLFLGDGLISRTAAFNIISKK